MIAEAALDAGRDDRDVSELALGLLLSANALDLAGLALHHVLSQTVVRVLETPHAETNAALLPVTMDEMRAGRRSGSAPWPRHRARNLRGSGSASRPSAAGAEASASSARSASARGRGGDGDGQARARLHDAGEIDADLERLLEAAWQPPPSGRSRRPPPVPVRGRGVFLRLAEAIARPNP